MGCFTSLVLTIIRWGIILTNILFLASGVTLIVLGSILLINMETLSPFFYHPSESPAIILVTAGALTVVVTFLGCLGAFKKSSWMMYTYAGFLFAIVALQLVGGIMALDDKDSFQGGFKHEMQKHMENYLVNGDGDLYAKTSWDDMQIDYKCCGITDFHDWATIRPEVGGVPDSCKCAPGSDNCRPIGPLDIFDAGCYTRLEPSLIILVNSLGGVGISVALIMFASAVLSLFLGRSFGETKRRNSHQSDEKKMKEGI